MTAAPQVRNALAELLTGLPVILPSTHGRHSLAEQVALRAQAQWGTLDGLGKRLELTPAELLAWHYNPALSLRPVQRPPDKHGILDWRTWFFCGGRGSGKTHGGSCWVIETAREDPEARILVVGPTDSEIRKTQLEGPSGILTLAPPWFKPHHQRSKRTLVFPNGAMVFYVPAQNSDKFRGYNVTDVWADEIVAWKKQPLDVLEQCRHVARLATSRKRLKGEPARMVITTTPGTSPLFRAILEDKEGLVLAQSSIFDNAHNLDAHRIRWARAQAHTTMGRRELHGELFIPDGGTPYGHVTWARVPSLERLPARPEKPGDWMPAKYARPHGEKISKPFDFLVVSVDPATGEKKTADLHGIVVEGFRWEVDGLLHTYVLADLSLQAPEASSWAKVAVEAWKAWKSYAPPKRTWVFAETNTGGNLVKSAVKAVDGAVPVKSRRAGNGTGGKAERAAPVSMLAEAGLVHMVGKHHKLEDQLAKFTGQEGGHGRDDRADAFAWPIFLYVVPRREMRGAAGTESGPGDEGDEGEESEE